MYICDIKIINNLLHLNPMIYKENLIKLVIYFLNVLPIYSNMTLDRYKDICKINSLTFIKVLLFKQ